LFNILGGTEVGKGNGKKNVGIQSPNLLCQLVFRLIIGLVIFCSIYG
jgi:hypothetical protein